LIDALASGLGCALKTEGVASFLGGSFVKLSVFVVEEIISALGGSAGFWASFTGSSFLVQGFALVTSLTGSSFLAHGFTLGFSAKAFLRGKGSAFG
jgi:hypothetical protein